MPSFADVNIVGHLARPAEMQHSQNGNAYTRLTVPVGKRDEPTLWFKVTLFGKQAEWASEWQKGDLVSVKGELVAEEWTDKQGETHTDLVVKYGSARRLKWGDSSGSSGSMGDDLDF